MIGHVQMVARKRFHPSVRDTIDLDAIHAELTEHILQKHPDAVRLERHGWRSSACGCEEFISVSAWIPEDSVPPSEKPVIQ